MQFDQLRWRQFITPRFIGRAFLFGIFLTFTGQGSVQGQQSEARMTFRAIMQELGVEYLRLANALLIDNVKDLEGSAKAIQRHPLPEEIAAAIKSKFAQAFVLSNESMSKAIGQQAALQRERWPRMSQERQKPSVDSQRAV